MHFQEESGEEVREAHVEALLFCNIIFYSVYINLISNDLFPNKINLNTYQLHGDYHNARHQQH